MATITRRGLLAGAGGSLALPVLDRTAFAADAAPAADKRPNVVFILADDLGYADVSCYGRPDFSTPNIDRIAAGGMRFLQAYANSAVCSATRTALITGRYQDRLAIGLEEPLAADVAGLPPSHPTLPSAAPRLRLPHRAGRQVASRLPARLRPAEERLRALFRHPRRGRRLRRPRQVAVERGRSGP